VTCNAVPWPTSLLPSAISAWNPLLVHEENAAVFGGFATTDATRATVEGVPAAAAIREGLMPNITLLDDAGEHVLRSTFGGPELLSRPSQSASLSVLVSVCVCARARRGLRHARSRQLGTSCWAGRRAMYRVTEFACSTPPLVRIAFRHASRRRSRTRRAQHWRVLLAPLALGSPSRTPALSPVSAHPQVGPLWSIHRGSFR
jgi:hypothetical protein